MCSTKQTEAKKSSSGYFDNYSVSFVDVFLALMFQDQVGKMMELQKLLDAPIFSTSRRLLKEGRLYKVHATSGKMDQRYCFLER